MAFLITICSFNCHKKTKHSWKPPMTSSWGMFSHESKLLCSRNYLSFLPLQESLMIPRSRYHLSFLCSKVIFSLPYAVLIVINRLSIAENTQWLLHEECFLMKVNFYAIGITYHSYLYRNHLWFPVVGITYDSQV